MVKFEKVTTTLPSVKPLMYTSLPSGPSVFNLLNNSRRLDRFCIKFVKLSVTEILTKLFTDVCGITLMAMESFTELPLTSTTLSTNT